MTAPPAGALEACLALLVEQMDMLHDDFVSYSDGKPTVPFVVLRDALVATLNAYDDARPALLAALRLREWCETWMRRIEREADAHTYFADNADLRMTAGDHAKRAKKLKAIRDDLARVLEEGE